MLGNSKSSKELKDLGNAMGSSNNDAMRSLKSIEEWNESLIKRKQQLYHISGITNEEKMEIYLKIDAVYAESQKAYHELMIQNPDYQSSNSLQPTTNTEEKIRSIAANALAAPAMEETVAVKSSLLMAGDLDETANKKKKN